MGKLIKYYEVIYNFLSSEIDNIDNIDFNDKNYKLKNEGITSLIALARELQIDINNEVNKKNNVFNLSKAIKKIYQSNKKDTRFNGIFYEGDYTYVTNGHMVVRTLKKIEDNKIIDPPSKDMDYFFKELNNNEVSRVDLPTLKELELEIKLEKAKNKNTTVYTEIINEGVTYYYNASYVLLALQAVKEGIGYIVEDNQYPPLYIVNEEEGTQALVLPIRINKGEK